MKKVGKSVLKILSMLAVAILAILIIALLIAFVKGGWDLAIKFYKWVSSVTNIPFWVILIIASLLTVIIKVALLALL